MLEVCVEYLFSFLDGLLFLYLFDKFTDHKIERKRIIVGAIFYALGQLIIEGIQLTRGIESIRDYIYYIIFMSIYMKNKRNYMEWFYIMMIDILFAFGISLFLILTKSIGINMIQVLIFGWERIIYTCILKIFNYYFIVYILSKIKLLQIKLSSHYFCICVVCMIGSEILLSTIIHLSELSYEMNLVMLLLLLIIVIFVTITLNYGITLKQNLEMNQLNQVMKIVENQVQMMMDEQNKNRKFIHDLKNKILKIKGSIKDSKLNEQLDQILFEYEKNSYVPICFNPFIDTILQKKINQGVKFDLQIKIPSNIKMETKELITLFVCLLEEIKIETNPVILKVIGNEKELSIFLKRNSTYKIKEFTFEMIQQIVSKYHGDIWIQDKEISVLLLLE